MTYSNKDNTKKHPLFSSREFLTFSSVIMIILSVVAVVPLISNDFFPYLRIGKEIVRTRQIPTTEFMTYTQYGNPANYPHWFFSLLFLRVFELGGASLTILISMIFIGSFYFLFWITLREQGNGLVTSSLVMLFVASIHSLFFTMRPQVLTYPFLGIVLLIITRWLRGNDQHLWVLPIVSFLWSNIHGSFIIVFFIMIPAIIFGSGNRKKLAVISIISIVSTFINFYPFESWKRIFSMVNNQVIRQYITEWKPPVNDNWQMNLLFSSFLIIPILIAIVKPETPTVYWVWYLGFGWMALTSIRYIIWLLPFEALILSKLFDPLIKNYMKFSRFFQNQTLNIITGLFLLMFPLTLLPGVRNHWLGDHFPVYGELTPVEVTNWIKDNPQLPNNVWTDFNYACYFVYEIPHQKVFMSNRIQDLSLEIILDNYQISQAAYNLT